MSLISTFSINILTQLPPTGLLFWTEHHVYSLFSFWQDGQEEIKRYNGHQSATDPNIRLCDPRVTFHPPFASSFSALTQTKLSQTISV
jgi:hypothetical protein